MITKLQPRMVSVLIMYAVTFQHFPILSYQRSVTLIFWTPCIGINFKSSWALSKLLLIKHPPFSIMALSILDDELCIVNNKSSYNAMHIHTHMPSWIHDPHLSQPHFLNHSFSSSTHGDINVFRSINQLHKCCNFPSHFLTQHNKSATFYAPFVTH